jgi:hypothetical protein
MRRTTTYTGVWSLIDRLNRRHQAAARKAERAEARAREVAAAQERKGSSAAAFDRKILQFRQKGRVA